MILGQEHELPRSRCTACGKELDLASGLLADAGVDDNVRPGDVTVCLGCGHVMAFDDDLGLRDLTDDEVREVAGDARLLIAQKARAAYMKRMRHCFNCGAELGIYVGRPYHPLDTCGKLECERAAADAVQRERQEALSIYTVYWDPSDHPGKYVMRVHDVPGGPRGDCVVGDALEDVREHIPMGLLRIPRHANDDPVIYEVWL